MFSVELDFKDSSMRQDILEKKLPPEAIKSVRKPELLPMKKVIKEKLIPYVKDEDWFILVQMGKQTYAYPLSPLIWHEVVNEKINGQNIGIAYCVLTGSGTVFQSKGKQNYQRTFGVSGYLYNSNLVMYDYQTGSLWPQLSLGAMSGNDSGFKQTLLPYHWVRFSYLKKHYPQALVFVGGENLEGYREKYNKMPFAGLENYETEDTMIRAKVDESALKQKQYNYKDRFVYFPDTGEAASFSYLTTHTCQGVAVVIQKGEIQALINKTEKPFIVLYYFALNAFFPDAKILG